MTKLIRLQYELKCSESHTNGFRKPSRQQRIQHRRNYGGYCKWRTLKSLSKKIGPENWIYVTSWSEWLALFIAAFRSVYVYRRFGDTSCLYHQGNESQRANDRSSRYLWNVSRSNRSISLITVIWAEIVLGNFLATRFYFWCVLRNQSKKEMFWCLGRIIL